MQQYVVDSYAYCYKFQINPFRYRPYWRYLFNIFMKTLKTLFFVALMLFVASCSEEKTDPLQMSVLDELTDEEIAQVEETFPEFQKKYRFIHGMVIMSHLMEDPNLENVSYRRMIDFLDYRPDTATLLPRCREEWKIQYAEMDTLDTAYVPYWKFKNDMIMADLRSYDSLCCEIFTRASSHVMIIGGKK